ncbi:hypothetical protein Pse7367_0746 [Thalassoporum mexicanum PCC 7367]|uniref:DUF3616 domain-containing protein n=1 Tax=Thalassoporum mexicanum TaxID=3457544 RepID=UPI00029F8A8E|nr:DUF3616 domain-containing protein [Pseudanabaena sp. PCC 7367]AFY69047.1 hypothetical protein Pse7367_0746 [Pseudanabaena sp. PCC 7367]
MLIASPRSRLLLEFDPQVQDLTAITNNLSAVTLTNKGKYMWLGADELTGDTPCIDRLERISEGVYGNHQRFDLTELLDIHNAEEEIDIEGLDYSDRYLWLTGSHSSTRKKPKPEEHKTTKSIDRLGQIKPNLNRSFIARIPLVDGKLHKSVPHPNKSKKTLTAACLQKNDLGNELLTELSQDSHLAPYINALVPMQTGASDDAGGAIESVRLPSKENGLDVEGLAVVGDRLFLGLRGPVLRGEWAIILEIELKETKAGILNLKSIGDGKTKRNTKRNTKRKTKRKYKKHFVALNGLGVRDLCYDQESQSLLILAGATMNIRGGMQLFRLKDVVDLSDDSIATQADRGLERIAKLDCAFGTENAEGIEIFDDGDRPKSLLVVYDAPLPERKLAEHKVLADIITF